jgi:hypothetical protein
MKSSGQLIDVVTDVRCGLEVWIVRVNGVEHASYWSPQMAEAHARRLTAKVQGRQWTGRESAR